MTSEGLVEVPELQLEGLEVLSDATERKTKETEITPKIDLKEREVSCFNH